MKIKVIGYDACDDTFVYTVLDNVSAPDSTEYTIPGELLPVLTREYSEPEEFIDREFDVILP